MTLQETWEHVLQKLKEAPGFNLLFNNIDDWRVTFDENDSSITIRASSNFLLELFKDRHLNDVIRYAREVSERKISFGLKAASPEEQSQMIIAPPPPRRENTPEARPPEQLCLFDPQYTFYTFVAATSNQWAITMCRKAANWKSEKHEGLIFISGQTGVGKTHLLKAVIAEARKNRPRSRVLFISARTFVHDFTDASYDMRYGNKKTAEEKFAAFRSRFQGIQILAVDDIHFFIGKPKSVDALHAIYDDIKDRRGIILFSSVLKPELLLKNLKGEFGNRLKEALKIEIDEPGLELLAGILENKARLMELSLGGQTLNALARSADGPRAITGILAAVKSCAETFGLEPENAAQKLLSSGKIVPGTNVDFIKKAVAEEFGVETTDLSSNSRGKKVVEARDAAIYLCREILKSAQEVIAGEFNRNRSMVSTIVIKIQKKMKEDPALADRIEKIKKRVSAPQP